MAQLNVFEPTAEVQEVSGVFIDNCGHGYLQVSKTDFCNVMTKEQRKTISGYSGIKGNYLHLEEDCDAGRFLDAAKAKGIEVNITNSYQPNFECSNNYKPF